MQTVTREGIALAYEFLPGRGPVVVFLPGFASDMNGTKAVHLRAVCAARGQAMLRLDYAGCGQSGGAFTDGSIGGWTADAQAVIEAACGGGDLILVGSSMGGWIALLLALRLAARCQALLLVAPAADMTERLMLPALGAVEREMLQRDGVVYQPSPYGAPTPVTLRLIEDGYRHLLLDAPIQIGAPVRILHGMVDEEVPWQHSLALVAALAAADVRLTLIKDGDHRLSRPADLALLAAALQEVWEA